MEFISDLINFLIFTVIVKIIVGHWLAEQIMKWAKVWFGKTERNEAIWQHYQARAAGSGHQSDSVLNCQQERCKVFAHA